MTAHVPMARVPFAPLDNPRLQHLASAKNRQNGLISKATVSSGKPAAMSIKSPSKRPFEPAIFDDYDSENVDPASLMSPTKKSKSDASDKPFKPFTFTMKASTSMSPPPPARLTTPARANMPSPRASLTAPAGRSPTKRKGSGLLNNKFRRTSAPFSRIDPPSFNASLSSSSLPFSLDAALSGTFSTPTSAASTSSKMGAGATIAERMPKDWFFDIHEDTPEEEASNLMEHSTLTLDLSSDDESEKRRNDERGKENTPPDGYDALTASRPVGDAIAAALATAPVRKADIVRKKVVADEMDDGERSPLANLETDPFIPEGLGKEAHVIVDPTPEKAKCDSAKAVTTSVPSTARPVEAASKKSSSSSSSEVTIWEDVSSPVATWSPADASTANEAAGTKTGKTADDENTQPTSEDLVL